MTAYCPSADTLFPFLSRTGRGSSETADMLTRRLDQVLNDYALPRIEPLVADIEQIMLDSIKGRADDGGITPVDAESAQVAITFARLLPRSIPAPDVAPDPDGEISFDWIGPTGKMFSVSISKSGRIAYAGRFGEKSKVHGTEELSDTCPPEILRGIWKTFGGDHR